MNKDVEELSSAIHYLGEGLSYLMAIKTSVHDKQIMTIADVIEELRAKQ